MRPVPAFLLQLSSAMCEIFLVPRSQEAVQLLFSELFVAVVFQITFSVMGTQQGCCRSVCQCREAKYPPVHPLRCSVPAPWCWSRAQSLGQDPMYEHALLCV